MSEQPSALIADPLIGDMLAQRDLSRPVGMLNLLKFRQEALYAAGSGEVPCTGEEAYARYAALVAPILTPLGARVLMTGVAWLIGPPGEWDRAFVVHYERGSDVLNLGVDPAYRRIVHHRTAALAASRLLMLDFDASGLR